METSTNSNADDNRDASVSHPIESETIESWTFLGDESVQQCTGAIDNIIEHHDEDAKLSSKTSRSSSSGLS